MSRPLSKNAALLVVGALCAWSAPPAGAQLHQQFSHPSSPHVDWNSPPLPITVPELHASPTASVQLPVLVVLLEFSDLTHQAAHTSGFYQDMVLGTGASGPWTSVRPSVAQTWAASTNNRLTLVPATAGDNVDGSADGVVGWVTAQCPPGVPGTCGFAYYAANIQKKRAEGIRRADAFFDYSLYDDDGDGVITSDELLVLVVNADSVCCDDHAAVGHPDPGGCGGCPGGNARNTDPSQVLVEGIPPDGWYVHQLVAGLTEGAHANVYAHEIGHQVFGLGDLYAIASSACNPYHQVSDGYVCYPWISCGSGCKTATNDACASATCLEDGVSVRGSNQNASGTDTTSCGTSDTDDVWFTYRPLVSESVTISLCVAGCTASSTILDTTLAVFDACNGNQLPAACNDDYDCDDDGFIIAPCDRSSQLALAMTAGTTYWIRVAGYNQAEGDYRLTVQGGGGVCSDPPELWYPLSPARHSLMAVYPEDHLTHLDPWAKIHLGFVKPQVVTHDGVYTLFEVDTQRSFALQDYEPEALVVYDPLRSSPTEEYFVLENRDLANLASTFTFDRGMAVWLINEEVLPGQSKPDLRRAVRLVRRGGHHANDFDALWDGSNPTEGYDLTDLSAPRDSRWSDGSSSHVEVTEISAAGPIMTFHVRMTPIFVDFGASPPLHDGSEAAPWPLLSNAVNAVASQDLDGDGQQDGPRTIRMEAGSYTETLVIDAPCTIRAVNGSAVIGS